MFGRRYHLTSSLDPLTSYHRSFLRIIAPLSTSSIPLAAGPPRAVTTSSSIRQIPSLYTRIQILDPTTSLPKLILHHHTDHRKGYLWMLLTENMVWLSAQRDLDPYPSSQSVPIVRYSSSKRLRYATRLTQIEGRQRWTSPIGAGLAMEDNRMII